jgi:hypothetical protein
MNGVASTRPVNLPQTVDPSGNAVITLPTIAENNTHHFLGSGLSTASHISTSSEAQPPYMEKKIFIVTPAKDPVSNDQ